MTTCTCRRCGRDLNQQTQIEEHQESIKISFRAGYGSVFGDGNVVKTTFCQHCLKEVLGDWIVVVEDDPFEPKLKVEQPRQAYQPSQLTPDARSLPTREDERKLFPQLQTQYG